MREEAEEVGCPNFGWLGDAFFLREREKRERREREEREKREKRGRKEREREGEREN